MHFARNVTAGRFIIPAPREKTAADGNSVLQADHRLSLFNGYFLWDCHVVGRLSDL